MTDPTDDTAEFKRLQMRMLELIKHSETLVQLNRRAMDEFRQCWMDSEKIKNRWGGMPPSIDVAEKLKTA